MVAPDVHLEAMARRGKTGCADKVQTMDRRREDTGGGAELKKRRICKFVLVILSRIAHNFLINKFYIILICNMV